MSATPAVNAAVQFFNEALPQYLDADLAASESGGRGQFMTISPATGLASLNDGTVPGQIAGGIVAVQTLTESSSVAGNASARLSQQVTRNNPASTISGDGFAAADIGKPFWIASENTPGKLSNYGGSNRSMGGFVVGIDDNDCPILVSGVTGQLIGRSAMVSDAIVLGSHKYAVDAGAATDLTEIQFSDARAKLHGVITSIEFIANATLAADATNYKTLTVTKYAADGTTPVVVGTMTTVLVTTKWVAKQFTLSAVAGALNILEGDLFTIQNSHTGSGAVTPAGVIRINGKAI